VSALLAGAAALAGAGVGYGCGALGVYLEGVEKLEAEEIEERDEFFAEQRRLAERAGEEGDPPPPPVEWRSERYGFTYLECVVAPLLGALGFVAFAAHDGISRELGIHLLWVSVFLHITVFDLKHRLVLNRVTYPAIAAAILLAPATPGLSLSNALVGAAVLFVFFMLQSLLLGGSVMGMGDAKLGALVGATTGIGTDLDHLGAVYALIAAAISGGVVALILLVTRVRGLRDPIPYGPFLCAGAALIMYHGPAGP
jgi:prepilin signal peptidase PulO-like enzyme (type II secretory pathway)